MNRKTRARWTELLPVQAALAAKLGLNDSRIADRLGITPRTLAKWKSERPVLKQALELARANVDKGNREKFDQYLFQRLSLELQSLWRKLMFCKDHKSAREKAELALSGKKELLRQQLFVHAMIYTNFNASEAGRIVNVPARTHRDWKKNSPQFFDLLAEIEEHKRDFFEGALTDLVAAGDSAATVFANRTYNRNRGYGEKPMPDFAKQQSRTDSVVPIDELNLPIETKRQLLDAIRAFKARP